ncbi:helix-turn-helix domain-containing protein [Bacillus thuringiensis]
MTKQNKVYKFHLYPTEEQAHLRTCLKSF